MSVVSIRIRVAGGKVKVGGGRYLRDAHSKRHSLCNAARQQRFRGRVQGGDLKPPTCGEFFWISDALLISEPPFYPVRSIYLLVFNSPDSLRPQGCHIQAFPVLISVCITIMFVQILGRPIVGPCVTLTMVTLGYCLQTNHRAPTGHVMCIKWVKCVANNTLITWKVRGVFHKNPQLSGKTHYLYINSKVRKKVRNFC